MEQKHRDVLIQCYEALVEDLEPTDIFPHLIQEKILTLDHQEKIKNIDTRKSMSEEVLTMLPTRGPRAYEVFVKALEKTQPFLACLLLREELSLTEAKCKDLESQLEEALNRSCDKQSSGKKRNFSKKKKNNTKEKLGTIPITVATNTVTTKRTAPGQNALQKYMNKIAGLGLELFPLTTDQNLQNYCKYLTRILQMQLTSKTRGSLKLTVHCRSLEILEQLWDDYCSGHLDSVAEECLVTNEVKSESDGDTSWLETIISEEDYLRCKKFLTELSAFNSLTDKETAEMENIKYKNILFKFQELLLEYLDPDEISVQLIDAGVLTSHDKHKIEERQTHKDKSKQLLMILATKGPRAYEEFVKALEKDNCFLACQLLKEEKENLLYEVKESKWQLKEAIDEEEKALTAASEYEELNDELERDKRTLLEEKKLRDQELKELLAERSEKENLEILCMELEDKLQEAKYAEPRKKVITWEEILRIVEDIGSSWLDLGRGLELEEAKLRKIDKRNKSNYEKSLAVLEMWMNNAGSDATVGNLEDTLKRVGMGSIADKLFVDPEEEIPESDYEKEVEKVLDEVFVGSRQKEGSIKDSVEDIFKELNISRTEDSSQGKKTKQKSNKKRALTS